jgi:hypothetical protein
VPVVSLVILGDTSKKWSPTKYGWDIGGCKMGIEFPVVKLMDYNDRWSELPKDEEALFQEDLRRIEEELAMPYVTAIERMGEERGRQQGIQQILKRQMSRHYGPLPGWAEERLAKASVDDLELWADRVLDAASIEEVFGSNGA